MQTSRVKPSNAPSPRATLGSDGTDYHVLRSTPDGRVLIAEGALSTYIVDPVTYIGQWSTSGADYEKFYGDAVPAGRVLTVGMVMVNVGGSTATKIYIGVETGGVAEAFERYNVADLTGYANNVHTYVLAPGERLFAQIDKSSEGDTMQLRYNGYLR